MKFRMQVADSTINSQKNSTDLFVGVFQNSTSSLPADTSSSNAIPGIPVINLFQEETSLTQYSVSSETDTIITPAPLVSYDVGQERLPDDAYKIPSLFPDLKWNFNNNFLVDNPLQEVKNFNEQLDSVRYLTRQTDNQMMIITDRIHYPESWLTGLVLFIAAVLVWIQIFYGKFYSNLVRSFSSFQISVKMYHERNMLVNRVSYILDGVYFLVLSVFIFQLLYAFDFMDLSSKRHETYLMILITLLGYYFIRLLLLRVTGFIFDIADFFSEVNYQSFIFNKIMGIMLYPLIILTIYMQTRRFLIIYYLGLVFFVAVFAMKLLRSRKIIIQRGIWLFYLFLYLCTLEILPLLLGYKLIKSVILSN